MSFPLSPNPVSNRPVQTDPAPAGRTASTQPRSPLTASWKATFAQSKPLFALRVLFNLTIVGAVIDAVATTVGHKLGNLGQNAAPVAPSRQASSNAEVLARDRAALRARGAGAGTPSQRADGAALSKSKVARHAEAIARMPEITRGALTAFRELPDAPPGSVLTSNPIRSNSLVGKTWDHVVGQALEEGTGSLPFAEAINVPRTVWAGQTVLPPNLLAEMARHESIPHSLGAMTFNNTLGSRTVPDNTPAQRLEAALTLRQFIQTKLNPEQRAALQERIDFLAQLPPLMLQKFGAPSPLDLGKPDQALAVWMKSIGVSGFGYLGLADGSVAAIMGQRPAQSMTLINDAVVALVLHRDVVFAASDPDALTAGIATAEKNRGMLQTRLANVGDFEALETPAHFEALRAEVTKQVRELSGVSASRPQGTLGLHDVVTRYASVYQKAAEGDAAARLELPQLRRTLAQVGYETAGQSFDAAFKNLHDSITALVQNTPLQEARAEARTLSRKIEEQETHLTALRAKHAASVGDGGTPAPPAAAASPAQLPARVAGLPLPMQEQYQQLVSAQIMSADDAFAMVTDPRPPATTAAEATPAARALQAPALVQAAIANPGPATTQAVLKALLDPAVPAATKQAIRTGLHQGLTTELSGQTGEAATAVLNRWSAALLYSAGQQAVAIKQASANRDAAYLREQALETAIRQNLQNRTGGNVGEILVQTKFSTEGEVQLGLSDLPSLARADEAFALTSSGNRGIEGLVQQAIIHGTAHPGQPLFAALNTGGHWVSTVSVLDPATGRLQVSVVDTDFQPGKAGYVDGQPSWLTTLRGELAKAGADRNVDYRGFDLQSEGRAGNACGPFTCMVHRDLARQMSDAQNNGLPPPPVGTMVNRWAEGWQGLAAGDQQDRIADERAQMFHQVHRGLVDSGVVT